VPATPKRRQQISAFYAANADRLRRTVARRARDLPDATIEDACQTAWTTLVRRPDISLDRHGFAWLATTAVHEAWQHHQRTRVESPAGAFLTRNPGEADAGELPEPIADSRDIAEQVADRIQNHQRLADLAAIKPQERQALYLGGLGYTYHQIMALTGATYTAVISGRLRQRRGCWWVRRRRHVADRSVAAVFRPRNE